MRRQVITVAFAVIAMNANADLQVVAHAKLNEAGSITHEIGPAVLKDAAGNALQRQGEPRHVAGAPQGRKAGCLRFEKSGYVLKKALIGVSDPFVLEAWVQAEKADDPGLHGVVSHGDGARGYTIAQQGSRWVAFVGGRGAYPMGPVVSGMWTHLAMVAGGSRAGVYVNGERTGGFPGSTGVTANFSIGDMGGGKEHFAGLIHEVRLARVGPGGFDSGKDFLMDYARMEEIQRETIEKRKAKLRKMLEGVELADRIDVPRHEGDWLVQRCDRPSAFQVATAEDGASATCVLANGLVTRTFHLAGGMACYSLRQEPRGLEFLRSIKPEATLTIGGKKIPVGGLKLSGRASGRKGRSNARTVANFFLAEWLDDLAPDPNAFQPVRIKVSKPGAWLKWAPMSKQTAAPWPPKGIRVSVEYKLPSDGSDLSDLSVTVHYELYDGIPAMGKWLSFRNEGDKPVTIDRVLIEELAFADEKANQVFVESEYNHFHALPVRWYVDPEFTTDSGPVFTERMSDYRLRYWGHEELEDAAFFRGRATGGGEWAGEYKSRSLMQVQYPQGPSKTLAKGESWQTFKSWLLIQDNMDEERKGLGRRKLYRTIFPWSQENFVYMHVIKDNSAAIRQAVDQCAACGFDKIILTFGSGFNMMNRDPKYIARVKADFDYAHGKGIKTGAYILFCSSRSYGRGEHDAKPPAYGRSLCLGSAFAENYFKQLIDFMKAVGQDCIETDGPYHGYRCERKDHPLHRGVNDSWCVNWEQQERFYRMCMDEGIYIITPDWYFASGARKMPMGYKESNWTLPRPQQALVARQNIYDGTWWRTPSMSYHALPLTSIYGGGPESTMEPLSQHLDAYDRVLGAYFGMGIMACYRGYRLYDTDETKAVVKGWVDFYRKHQAILDSDIIHVRRPDGRDLDCMMHANPALKEKGLAFVWNPTGDRVQREFELPLYYTGLTETAQVSEKGGGPKTYRLDREYRVKVPVDIPANGYKWFVIQ